jgi:hypothetical protein
MSNYSAPTRHPFTNEIKMADWLDDSFGRHVYGVRFHGEELIYHNKDCVEMGLNEMQEEIERLLAALEEVSKAVGDPSAYMIARAALAGEKTND